MDQKQPWALEGYDMLQPNVLIKNHSKKRVTAHPIGITSRGGGGGG